MRSLKVLLVCIFMMALFGAIAQATEMKTIVFDGKTYDGKGIPSSVDHVLKAIKAEVPKATFGFKDGSLLVGLPDETGELKLTHNSDCPVNSSFGLEQTTSIAAKKLVKPVTVAWTQVRHPKFGKDESELERYNQTEGSVEVVLRGPKTTGRR